MVIIEILINFFLPLRYFSQEKILNRIPYSILYLGLLYSAINIIGFLMLFEYDPSKNVTNVETNSQDTW